MSFKRLLTIGLLAAASMCADVTLRYKTAFKLNPSLPPQMTEQVTKGMADSMPAELVIQLKEGKGASSFGKLRSVTDFMKQRMTLIDPEKKRLVTISVEQLTDELTKAIAELPAQSRDAAAAMKSTAESRITGRTETILGIEAEEREVTISLEGPALPNMAPGPMFKMAIEFWTAKAGEVLRVPALREITGYNLWANATMNPAGAVEKMLKQMPGMGEGLGKIMKEMESAKATMLRSNFRMWMPALAAMMKQMPPDKNPLGDKFDADAPFMEMTQEVSELSSATVAESVFAIPEGYQETSAAEMVRAMMPKPGGKQSH
jgi:hypothetical protein